MSKAVRIHAFGGPDVLKCEDVPAADPKAGEVLVRHTAIGLNFVDTYHRSNQLGENPPLPCVLGVQGAGVVEKLGDGVKDLKKGDRVTYTGIRGSYCEERCVPAARMIKTPDDVSDEMAAATFLRGLTVEYLIRRLHKVQKGETILVQAAAGGVGQILVQWAKAMGAVIIGTVGSDEKAALAKKLGCDHPIVYTRENFVERVKEITGGKGVPVAYDSVGKTTFMGSLDCLAPMGHAINYGTASGSVEPFPIQRLHKNSLTVTRPTLGTYIASRADLESASKAFFDVLRNGTVKVDIAGRYKLKDTAKAHADLESRKIAGPMIIVP
jgi:NADPH:quinone reductase-like Zn-dependent oxidoreductase